MDLLLIFRQRLLTWEISYNSLFLFTAPILFRSAFLKILLFHFWSFTSFDFWFEYSSINHGEEEEVEMAVKWSAQTLMSVTKVAPISTLLFGIPTSLPKFLLGTSSSSEVCIVVFPSFFKLLFCLLFLLLIMIRADVKVNSFGSIVEASSVHYSSILRLIHPYHSLLSRGNC